MEGYIREVLLIAGIYAIVAVGMYFVLATGILSAGQAAFMGIGAYSGSVLTVKFDAPFEVALVVGPVVAGLVALPVSILALRLSHMFLAVATLAFGEAMVVVALNSDYLGAALGFRGMPLRTNIWLVYVCLALIIVAAMRFHNSRLGQAYRAVAEDDLTAAALGIDVVWCRIQSFVVGAMLAGLGGVLYAHLLGVVDPHDMNFARSLTFLIFATVGGVTTFWGAVLGSLALTGLPEFLRFSTYDRYLVYGLILVLIMLFRPKGLLARRQIVDRVPLKQRLTERTPR